MTLRKKAEIFFFISSIFMIAMLFVLDSFFDKHPYAIMGIIVYTILGMNIFSSDKQNNIPDDDNDNILDNDDSSIAFGGGYDSSGVWTTLHH